MEQSTILYRGMDRATLAGREHFSIMDELSRPDGRLVPDLQQLIAQV
jgi:hypothetical protein